MLEVIDVREVDAKRFIKLFGSARKGFAAQLSEQVSEIVAAMKHNPFDVLIEDESLNKKRNT